MPMPSGHGHHQELSRERTDLPLSGREVRPCRRPIVPMSRDGALRIFQRCRNSSDLMPASDLDDAVGDLGRGSLLSRHTDGA